jgi:hypothetical protein
MNPVSGPLSTKGLPEAIRDAGKRIFLSGSDQRPQWAAALRAGCVDETVAWQANIVRWTSSKCWSNFNSSEIRSMRRF